MTLEEGACAVRMWWAIKAARVCLSIARQIKRLVDRPPNDFSMDEKEDVREERSAGAST